MEVGRHAGNVKPGIALALRHHRNLAMGAPRSHRDSDGAAL